MADFSTPITTRQAPNREDCWSEDATSTLIESWGTRYMDMNRGNLRQKDWQDVADAVNAVHGLCPKTRRSDIQCKNRIDTVKKKFKSEKAKIDESNGSLVSSWRFYSRVEYLIGPNLKYLNRNANANSNSSNNVNVNVNVSPVLSTPVFVGRKPVEYGRMVDRKPLEYGRMVEKTGFPVVRKEMSMVDMPPVVLKRESESGFKRNYSVMAAAAAAEEDEEEEEEYGEEGGVGEEDGLRSVAKAIGEFGEMYERVETMKAEQTLEMEKQRLRFARDVEVQRMQMLVDLQMQLVRTSVKRVKQAGSDDDMYS